MGNWWKCRIARATIPFPQGAVIYARNGEDLITLFDGKKEAQIPKMDLPRIKLLYRLNSRDSEMVQRDYLLKTTTNEE